MKSALIALMCLMLAASPAYADDAGLAYDVLMTEETWSGIDPARSGFASAAEFYAYVLEVIQNIAGYLNRPQWYQIYGEGVVIVYRMTDGPSHAEGGYGALYNPIPITYLNQRFFEAGVAPIAHETTHILFPGYSLLSLREGLACYCHELFGGNPTVFSFDVPVHEHMRYLKETSPGLFAETLAAIGQPRKEINFTKGDARAVFYTISHSLTKYIFETYGVDAFMALYESDPKEIPFETALGKPLAEVKSEWLAYVDALPQGLTNEEIGRRVGGVGLSD